MELRALLLGEVPLNLFNFCELEVKLHFFLSLLKSICCLLSHISILHCPEFVFLKDPDMPIKLSVTVL